MTNSISYPNQQYPQNYSGVTIHVNNPALNTMSNGYISQPTQPCQHQPAPQYPVQTCQHCQPQAMPAPMYNPYPQQDNYANNAFAQPIAQMMQAPMPLQNQPVNPQYMASVYNPAMSAPTAMPPQQNYPPQYYLNNYNYIQDSRGGMPNTGSQTLNGMQPMAQAETNPYVMQMPPETPVVDNDMETSKQIIQELDARLAAEKNLQQNGKQKRVVALTNEYIMSLENYLNNPNSEIRLMASKEILTRLNEDKNRYNDAALNALLNKMLQDPDKLVRVAALSAFSSQLASGNEYTVKLLQDIQNNPNSSKEDVVEAANILLKMSADTEIKYEPVKQTEPKPSKNEAEAQRKQIEQLQQQIQAQRQKELEAQLAQQMQQGR